MPVPWREAVDTDDHSGVGVDVLRYDGVVYQDPATQWVRLACEVAPKRALSLGGCDWDNLDVTDYFSEDEHLSSRRFGMFLVADRSSRITVNAKSRVTVYSA